MAESPTLAARRLTGIQWLICTLAAIGFAFDTYELLMAQFIMRPALSELGGLTPGTLAYGAWASRLFYIPAVCGGAFGLLGGYLTDRMGRRRVLTWSILLYAFSAFAAGFSTSLKMLLVLRCTTLIGVCVEFVAAVAWLAELFDDPRQRERVLGYTQAFSSLGGLMVAGASKLSVQWSASLPAVAMPGFMTSLLGTIAADHQHGAWRYTLMSGLIPALPLLLIRPWLPESPVWKSRKLAGTLKRPSLGELFSPALRRTTIVSTIMMACAFGAAFGAIQQIPQIVPGAPQLRQEVAAAKARIEAANPGDDKSAVAAREKSLKIEKGKIDQAAAASAGQVQEIGGLVGRVLLAVLALWIVSRQRLIRMFQVPGLLILPLVFAYGAVTDLRLLTFGVFLVGLFTVGQFSFWGNYLPRVYPVHLRGTGESFAANIGGRLIGTSFAAVTSLMAVQKWFFPAALAEARLAYAAAMVGTFVYVVGFVASFFLPEPPNEQLAD